jgi:voltage-gated potassium channel
MKINRYRHLLFMFIAMILLLAVGIVYFFVRTHNITDAIWLTITIASTMGMADANKFSTADKIFSSALVLLTVVFFTFLIALVSEMILSGKINELIGMKRMREKIAKLRGHYIVCGYGRIGKTIIKGLKADGKQFVILDSSKEVLSNIDHDQDVLYVEGDASFDDNLKAAGIDHAAGLFSALGDDAANLLTVLNARALNSKIKIVTRLSSQDLETRFIRAGADHGISPQSWGSQNMLLTMLNPSVSQMLMQFLDKTIEAGTFIELEVPGDSQVKGKTLGESGIRESSNINVIGIKKASNNTLVVNPQPDCVVESGDTLICLGNQLSFDKLKAHLGIQDQLSSQL